MSNNIPVDTTTVGIPVGTVAGTTSFGGPEPSTGWKPPQAPGPSATPVPTTGWTPTAEPKGPAELNAGPQK